MKIFKNFKEVQTLKPGFSVERIFGGAMLGIAGSDFVCFYDWAAAKVLTAPFRHGNRNLYCMASPVMQR